MKKELSPDQRNAIGRISGLVLLNALIFQEVLAGSNSKVCNLDKMIQMENIKKELTDHWKYITDEIDYFPIFHISKEILANISSNLDVKKYLLDLINTAKEIVEMRTALRHDLMGRIYHRLLVEKKYLGTYYTSIPAASLLLRLALDPKKWDISWSEDEQISKLRIGDLACGTGTLLMAAADAVTDNHISECAERKKRIDSIKLQNILNEKVLFGYDVLASAIHLTASTLALRAPEVAFEYMNLYTLPLGGLERRLGSIEYLIDQNVGMPHDLFGSKTHDEKIKGKGKQELAMAKLPDLDLCAMNPPFTRSVGGNLLFGSLPDSERNKTQSRLKEIIKKRNIKASITAGLGSVFVGTADKYIKDGGILALVLPKALLSGVAWEKTRDLIQSSYKLAYIVVSHDPIRWNFSESTSLSEVLLVAKKEKSGKIFESEYITTVNLWKNPTTAFEANAICHAILSSKPKDLMEQQGAYEIFLGTKKYGELVSYSEKQMVKQKSWLFPAAFAHSDLIRIANHLCEGRIWLPHKGTIGHFPICKIEDLGILGPDARDIHDGFLTSESKTSYPGFWGHSLPDGYIMEQKPNIYLSPLSEAKKGRPLRKLTDLWPLAGNILLAERLRLNSQGLLAIRTTRKVLSSVWWPLSLHKKIRRPFFEKALTLWFNSTFGLLIFLLHRLETEGPWVKFKKPILKSMPVLDIRELNKDTVEILGKGFDNLCRTSLLPFPKLDNDPTRSAIDFEFSKILDVQDIQFIRNLIANEPLFCLKSLYYFYSTSASPASIPGKQTALL
jgi:hypothetical protein